MAVSVGDTTAAGVGAAGAAAEEQATAVIRQTRGIAMATLAEAALLENQLS
jgi:hypothetical protein